MATKTASLKSIFRQFVELVDPIEEVQYVVAPEPGVDIYTFIKERNDAVVHQIFEQEYAMLRNFPDLLVDFHIFFLEGRDVQDFINPLPRLVFSRAKSG